MLIKKGKPVHYNTSVNTNHRPVNTLETIQNIKTSCGSCSKSANISTFSVFDYIQQLQQESGSIMTAAQIKTFLEDLIHVNKNATESQDLSQDMSQRFLP